MVMLLATKAMPITMRLTQSASLVIKISRTREVVIKDQSQELCLIVPWAKEWDGESFLCAVAYSSGPWRSYAA